MSIKKEQFTKFEKEHLKECEALHRKHVGTEFICLLTYELTIHRLIRLILENNTYNPRASKQLDIYFKDSKPIHGKVMPDQIDDIKFILKHCDAVIEEAC